MILINPKHDKCHINSVGFYAAILDADMRVKREVNKTIDIELIGIKIAATSGLRLPEIANASPIRL